MALFFCGWELKVKVPGKVGVGIFTFQSVFYFTAYYVFPFTEPTLEIQIGFLWRKLRKNAKNKGRKKLLCSLFHSLLRRTNINSASESVIFTFRCLFICHILEAFPWKGFLFTHLLFVIKSIFLLGADCRCRERKAEGEKISFL